MPTLHMICGPVGAGKTTYSRTFAAEQRALLCCLDEWMLALFMMDAPSPLSFEWALARTQRCEDVIWLMVRQVSALGLDAVLELGFFTRAQRARHRDLARASGLDVQVHLLDVPREVRRERVRLRNQGSATYTVEVDDAMFDWAEGYYEPLTDEELHHARVIRG